MKTQSNIYSVRGLERSELGGSHGCQIAEFQIVLAFCLKKKIAEITGQHYTTYTMTSDVKSIGELAT